MKRYLFTFIVVFLWSQVALGDLAGEADGFFYASGKAEAESQVDAENQACERAKRELIAYVFGLTTKVTSNSIQTLDQLQLTQTINVHSDWLFMKGLKQIVSDLAVQDRKYTIECKVLYPQAEALAEKSRIMKARSVLAREKINKATFESTDPVHFGRIMVKSNAPKAKVFLNGTLWGFAPLEIDCIPVGSHDLAVAADNFVTDSQKIRIKTGDFHQLFVTLKNSQSSLKVHGLPPDAHLWINGIKQSSYSMSIDPGEIIVRAEAPFYHPYQDIIRLRPGVDLEHQITLHPRNVPVSFVSKGERAAVYLDGSKLGEAPLSTEIAIGKHTADFIGSHGVIHSHTFDLKPSKGYTVTAPAAPKAFTKNPRFSDVVLYKNETLDVRKDYKSFNSVPDQDPDTKTVGFSFELVEPREGYIYINDELAGKKAVIVDEMQKSSIKIRFEAPGYHSDTVILTRLANEDTEEPKLPDSILTKYFGVNHYKVFLFKKRPVVDDRFATVVRRGSWLRRFNVVGFYNDYSFSLASCSDKCPPMGGYRMADLPVSLGRIPALTLEVNHADAREEINGLVTEILFKGPPGMVAADNIFYGVKSTVNADQTAGNGYLSERTLYVGETDSYTFIKRYSVQQGVCGEGWTSHSCRVEKNGPPFATMEIEVHGPNSSDVVNAKRYSP